MGCEVLQPGRQSHQLLWHAVAHQGPLHAQLGLGEPAGFVRRGGGRGLFGLGNRIIGLLRAAAEVVESHADVAQLDARACWRGPVGQCARCGSRRDGAGCRFVIGCMAGRGEGGGRRFREALYQSRRLRGRPIPGHLRCRYGLGGLDVLEQGFQSLGATPRPGGIIVFGLCDLGHADECQFGQQTLVAALPVVDVALVENP